MPRAFDRRTPKQDKNPLANLLDFENWSAAIDETADKAGQAIRDFNVGLAALAAEVGVEAQKLADMVNGFLTSIGLDPAQFEDPEFDPIEFILTWVEDYLLPTNMIGDAKWSDLYTSLTGETGGDLVKVTNFVLTGIYGPVTPNRIPMLPISHIGETENLNLLAGYTFENAETISGGEDVWVWDGDVGHTGPGSVTVNADGTSKELLSIDIAVSQGHKLTIGGWVKWAGLVGTGSPIQLAVTAYHGDGATEQAIIASHNTTPTTTDWLYLTGSYTTPAGVVSVRVRLVVLATATAGQVWWDDLSAVKDHNLLFQRLVSGQDGGTLTNDIENLFTGVWTNAEALLEKLDAALHNDLLSTLGGPNLTDIENRLNAFLHGGSILNADNIGLGQIADTFVPGLGTVHDNLVTRLLRVGGTGYTSTDSATALESMVHALVDVASRSSRLETVFTGGVSEGDDFERVSTSNLGAGWLLSYTTGASGIWATPNGHEASWIPAGIANREFLAIRNTGNVRSTTDLQEVAMVLSSVAPNFFGACGFNSVWLRISDATTGIADVTGIKIEFGGDGSLLIARYLNGTPTLLNSLPPDTLVPPGPGARIAGLAGEPGTARVFRALIGTSIRLEIPEVGTASALGGAARRWGHGGRATASLIGQRGPGSIHQWTGKDQLTS